MRGLCIEHEWRSDDEHDDDDDDDVGDGFGDGDGADGADERDGAEWMRFRHHHPAVHHLVLTVIVVADVLIENPTLAVSGGADLYVQGLAISGNLGAGVGVDVSGARVWLDRVRVVGNAGGGVALSDTAYASVRNCLVGGSATVDSAAIQVDGSSLDALYTTMVGYDDSERGGAALRCEPLVRGRMRRR